MTLLPGGAGITPNRCPPSVIRWWDLCPFFQASWEEGAGMSFQCIRGEGLQRSSSPRLVDPWAGCLLLLPPRISSLNFVETCLLSRSWHIGSTAGSHAVSCLSRIDQEMHWMSRKDSHNHWLPVKSYWMLSPEGLLGRNQEGKSGTVVKRG